MLSGSTGRSHGRNGWVWTIQLPCDVPPWWRYVVAPGRGCCCIDYTTDGVHEDAAIPPSNRDLLCAVDADPGWHLNLLKCSVRG